MNGLEIPKSLQREYELRKLCEWRSYHIFYGGSPLVVLRECIIPLARELKNTSIIEDFFFINYWLEGSHVRLRLRLHPENIYQVDSIVLSRVQDYLKKFPSYHPTAELVNNNFYESLFEGEFEEADRPLYFNEDGTPRFAQNNSIEIRTYEPEWLRYGGAVGMLISERYFVNSTEFMTLLADYGNLEVRTILLGLATQVTFITVACLLRNRERMNEFFVAYHLRWLRDATTPDYKLETGRSEHKITVNRIEKKILPWLPAIFTGQFSELPPFLQDWAITCQKTRQQIEDACSHAPLPFSYTDGVRYIDNPDEAAWTLCHSYVHMMNNRMTVSVLDEAFISYQITEAMRKEENHHA